ncbi:hydroxymethylglutaryl-CoA lyase [Desulfospira joergensenii]|uniref:hydroxymethylglutaryl-CoA lyase n=1 Tax=Desulfospira joergensenii TaxID=53329 RepID=UPI0003B3AEF6|nr:hydroxymethylglutaryl-CoA lyase [Desulfospira joergensenii]
MIKIVEVGPRDGLQNETEIIPSDTKVAFVNALSESGVSEIEVSAFVSPKRIPQLKDASIVFKNIQRKKRVIYSALVPNSKGLERAVNAGANKISVFTAASETFNQKNINTSVEGSMERFRPVVRRAGNLGLPVRGYISTAFWCAFEGKISPRAVLGVAQRLMDMGMDELSISDTIGKASPDEVGMLMDVLLSKIPAERIAVHFHDTYGRGIDNILRSVSYGIQIVDASVGGLGGCPFAPGATGNVATEAVVAALIKAGEKVAVDTERLMRAREMLDPYIPAKPDVLPPPDSPACSLCEFFDGKKCCGSMAEGKPQIGPTL